MVGKACPLRLYIYFFCLFRKRLRPEAYELVQQQQREQQPLPPQRHQQQLPTLIQQLPSVQSQPHLPSSMHQQQQRPSHQFTPQTTQQRLRYQQQQQLTNTLQPEMVEFNLNLLSPVSPPAALLSQGGSQLLSVQEVFYIVVY